MNEIPFSDDRKFPLLPKLKWWINEQIFRCRLTSKVWKGLSRDLTYTSSILMTLKDDF